MVRGASASEGPRSKRGVILKAAVESFGDDGFELTKWATIADKVGIGQTALYHYFESKVHCLLTIMSAELERSLEKFDTAIEGIESPTDQLRAVVHAAYEVEPHEVNQLRILQNHMDLLATPRPSKREEAERLHARKLVRDIEERWTDLIRRGIEAGEFVDRDPLQESRAVLALVVSAWRWYRNDGPTSLDEITDFMSGAVIRIVTG
jgi:AcrR family transcriptional regulator